MKIYKEQIDLRSHGTTPTFINITPQVKDAIAKSGIQSGIVTIISPHTTCSVFFEEFVHDTTEDGTEFLQVDLNDALKKIIPDLLANYKDALIRTESKTTFENVDCSGIQFIYAYLEAFYSADYNGSDPEARQAWVDAAFLMQSKMQKYKVKFSDAYPPPELYEITAPPNQWKEMMDEQMGLD